MKIRNLDLTLNPVNEEHQQLGLPPVEDTVSHLEAHPFLRASVWFAVIILVSLILFLIGRFFLAQNWDDSWQIINGTLDSRIFWIAVAVGFLAQVVDGALGMAYGITATTFLLASGASPAAASASVHIAEIFTTGVSGIAHAKFGNVNKQLFTRLLAPGILGGILGAVLVTHIDSTLFKPFISAYLLLLGIYILSKAFRQLSIRKEAPKHVGKLALFGSFMDAAGGGGWGPIVTTTLVGTGNDPRTTIGSVNFAEFFLTLTSAAVFALLMETNTWPLIIGLVFGGLFAAPFAAILCKKFHARTLLILVGILITIISSYNLYKAFISL
ncbi:sulfite exporter TauE/SafE family protein [Nitrosomonas sp. Is37]|uniref:sulfite exporter TauE/SafE family protein n=1 Tax=Nitrosomonas sp. Is37 TaxID=3080535 RepID=UPI00294B57DB|nr:sulfite exporter TauE/SafE family protein [Nitrosomonas sp. Is37]MDV6344707.1 sulfite exporter TauE/SafE family protein [Nitrosomonas sp. Is37]